MKHINEALDTTRKYEDKKLAESGITDLKVTRYLWLYSEDNLSEKYREKYNAPKNADLLAGKAYSMRENIRNLWNLQSQEERNKYWERWYSCIIHSSIAAMKDAARMMELHIDSILNYFTHKITNPRAEGINSKIALIEKMAYGYKNGTSEDCNILRMRKSTALPINPHKSVMSH